MATFRQVINEVLGIMSEDEVDSAETVLSSDYHKLVGHFVNQIKEEIEESHNWMALTTGVLVSAPAGENDISLGINGRSRLVRVQRSDIGIPIPVAFDVTDSSQAVPLQEIDESERYFRNSRDGETTTSAPTHFSMAIVSGTPLIHVYPTPLTARTYRLLMVVPQDRLAFDNLDVEIKIPNRPLELGALWYALMERGEELGINGLFTEERYRTALDGAIARDWAQQGGLDLVAM